jgi:hypothetical protein
MAPHQSYFDEYPSGAGTIDFLEEIISIWSVILLFIS